MPMQDTHFAVLSMAGDHTENLAKTRSLFWRVRRPTVTFVAVEVEGPRDDDVVEMPHATHAASIHSFDRLSQAVEHINKECAL